MSTYYIVFARKARCTVVPNKVRHKARKTKRSCGILTASAVRLLAACFGEAPSLCNYIRLVRRTGFCILLRNIQKCSHPGILTADAVRLLAACFNRATRLVRRTGFCLLYFAIGKNVLTPGY